MNDIVNITHIACSQSRDFAQSLSTVVNDYQNKGCVVDIQYSSCACDNSATKLVYSALIIAREKHGDNENGD